MTELYNLWLTSPLRSSKYRKYFDVYEKLFSRYKNTDITFVEIGVSNGGSLSMWRNYFTENSRIIGIELNPDAKKFEKKGIEIFIGDQSNESFWNNFFEQVGKVDVILDDGGHTNLNQIMTTVCCVPNIKDNGMLVVEDTHTSYMNAYFNPSDRSFINFSKKLIDDVNFKYPDIGLFNYSLNNHIYSIEFFESFVVFNINGLKASQNNELIKNSGFHSHMKSYTSHEIDKKFYSPPPPIQEIYKSIRDIKKNKNNKNSSNKL